MIPLFSDKNFEEMNLWSMKKEKETISSTIDSKHFLEDCYQDILGNSDTEVNQCKSPSKEKYQETQTDPFPQSPTTAILRKKIKILQMRLNHRNKKISNIAELNEEMRKKGHSNSDLEAALQENFSVFV